MINTFYHIIKNNTINHIIINATLDYNFMYFLKKLQTIYQFSIEWGSDTLKVIYNTIKLIQNVNKSILSYNCYSKLYLNLILNSYKFFQFAQLNNMQYKFWMQNYYHTLLLILQSFKLLFAFSFLMTFAVAYNVFYKMNIFGLLISCCEDNIKIYVSIASVINTCIVMAAQPVISTTALIAKQKIYDELHILSLLNIKIFPLWLQPKFYACIVGGLLLECISIIGVLSGLTLAWSLISKMSISFFLYKIIHYVDKAVLTRAFIRILFSSIYIGMIMCLGGMNIKSKHNEHLIYIILESVSYSIMGIFIINSIISLIDMSYFTII